MADLGNVSKVTLPNGDVAHFKDSTAIQRLDDFALKDIHSLQSNTYTGVYCTANSDPAGYLYFGAIHPTSYDVQWSILYRVHATIADQPLGEQISEVYISGMRDTYAAYRTWNEILHTSYRPYYAHLLYRCKQAGITNGYGHLLGLRFQSSWYSERASSARDIDVEILELKNCTFEFFDSMILYANAPGTGSTNYNTRDQFDGTTQGNTMSGDRDSDVANNVRIYYSRFIAGENGIKQYSLVMRDATGAIQSFTTTNGIAATKTKNPTGFRLGGIWYYEGSGNPAAGTYVGNATIRVVMSLLDLRYSLNLSGTNDLDPGPLYIVGTMHSDGLFYLDDTWWTQTEPTTDDGKVYIPLGTVYWEGSATATTNAYRLGFTGWQGAYWYKDGKFQEVVESAMTVNGHTVDKDVPSNAAFTDTTDLSQMTGTLGFAHGGTGQTSGVNAANALLNQLSTGSSTPTDNDYYISQYVGGGTTTTTYHRRPMSAMWTWIKSKIDAAYTNALTKYAGSDSAGGPANNVKGANGTTNAFRHVWFSDSNSETARNYDDDLKYNPSTNDIKLSAAHMRYDATTKSIMFEFD